MKKGIEVMLAITFLIGMLIAAGTIGNVEFADLTHTAGYTAGQITIRLIIAGVMMIGPAIIGNRLER